jgi:hypothetical protein
MKLELKHLAPYLPYGLKVRVSYGSQHTKRLNELCGLSVEYCNCTKSNYPYTQDVPYKDIKPLLRPLLDLTKEIEVNGERFVPLFKLCLDFCHRMPCNAEYGVSTFLMKADNDGGTSWWFVYHHNEMTFELSDCDRDMTTHTIPQYKIFEKLFEWHFDVFSLIPENLAIDLNTINTNQ